MRELWSSSPRPHKEDSPVAHDRTSRFQRGPRWSERRSNVYSVPTILGRLFAWVVGVNPPYRCDRQAEPRANRLAAHDLTGTAWGCRRPAT
jgi:hypothetical protein